MTDIDLYTSSPEQYEKLQNTRPDYTGAQEAFLELAHKHLKGITAITLADFCCGTGNNTKVLLENFPVMKATLIDSNKDLLKTISKSSTSNTEIETIVSDILDITLEPEHNLVISMFAYHHVPDTQKRKYIEIARHALKPGGILILGEIYTPNKDITLKYYEHLISSISPNHRTTELETFLTQTAQSENFEYKVSRDFAHTQFKEAGFTLLDSVKVWPTDNTFDSDMGTFVEVWKI